MVFGVGSDSDLWAKRYNDQWSDWESLGGTWMGSPVPVTYDPQSVAAYLIAPDRSVWSNYFQQGSWKKKPLGGWFPNDTLTATSWRPSQVDIFAVGKDGDLQHKWHYSRWSEWNSLGGTIYGRPKVITPQRNRLDVFAKGKDSKLYQKTFIGEAWTEWIDLGETHHYDPEAVSLTPDRIDLFSVGTDSQLMHSYCVDASDKEVGHFTPWEKLGGVCVGQPRAVMREGKTLDVFLKQSDSKLYRK
ncbi:MAG: hypothetical protein L6R42_003956, partial [Xanthoria sp. 1 TBL-2021]